MRSHHKRLSSMKNNVEKLSAPMSRNLNVMTNLYDKEYEEIEE